ncbi:methyltransferase domain-containing protein [Streptomyces sp. NPDC006435]|uniref:methyltransferase domain-containing protein n=1 Tax=Streptomyces sp. NPDC006435 TaxID=3154300 RepID=UPI0033B07F45
MRTNDAQMLVLCALADGPLHGYAINAAIEQVSGHRLGPGSLYGALARLEAKQLVKPLEEKGRQRPFRLTPAGRELLEREAHSMARLSGRVFESTVPDEVGYLDRLAATDAARSYKSVMLHALDARPGETALDLGCGPGTDLGALAEAVGSSGRVIGIDSSQEMVEQARRRTENLPAVEVEPGDIHTLPFEDGSIDRARTDRVLQHVTDPARALAEARRVLRPGGRLVMGEPDWDSLAIDHPDLEVSRAYTRHVTDRVVRNGVIGRQLARLALDAGFAVPTVVPVASVFRDVQAADQVLGIQRNTERAVSAGYLPAPASQRWLDHLATGSFFAAVTLYVVVAEAAS